MVTSIEQEKISFSARLNEILDESGFAPKGHGRQIRLGDKYGVSQKGARKWLEGEAIPRRNLLRQISSDHGVRLEWLEYGQEPKYSHSPSTSSPTELGRELNLNAVAASLYGMDTHIPLKVREAQGLDWNAKVFSKLYQLAIMKGPDVQPSDLDNVDLKTLIEIM